MTVSKKETQNFAVDKAACIGCGLCQIICPSEAISLHNGRPVWIKETCQMCMDCVGRCPVAAIQYYKR